MTETASLPFQQNRLKGELIPSPIVAKEKPSLPELPSQAINHTPLLPIESAPVQIKKPKQPKYTTVFTKQTTEALIRCGVNAEHINPTPIGQGSNHVVFAIDDPGEEKKVLKIGKPTINTMTEGHKGESENLDLATSYFTAKYIPKTIIHKDTQTDFYCVVQDAIKGNEITNLSVRNKPELFAQLKDIVQMNNKLYKEKKITLDFVGMNGFTAWLKKQFSKLLLRKSKFPVSNILVDEKDNLKIIDFEFFDLNQKVGLKKKIINWFCTTANRIFMKHYFGLDILE